MIKSTAKKWVLMGCLPLFLLAVFSTGTAGAQAFSVVDMAGRTVNFNQVPQKVILVESRDIHEFSALVGDDFPSMIAGWGPDLRQWDKDSYDKYKEKFPEIENIPEVGFMEEGTFDVEKALALKPDVVFLALWMYQWLDNAKVVMETFTKAGVPVVIVDYGLDPIFHPPLSIILTGKVLHREERAKAIADYYNKQVNDTIARLKAIGTPKPRVYVECGNKGPTDFGNTYVGHSWDMIIKEARGRNVAGGMAKATAPIDPEYLLSANPDVIVVTGSFWTSTPGAMRLGYLTEPQLARSLLQAYLTRPGWQALNAVKQQRVHAIFHGFSFRTFNFAALQAFAKWLYPKEFMNVEPIDNLRKFCSKFEPIDYSGTWLLDLYE